LLQTEIFITTIAIFISLYIFGLNLIKRYKFLLNRIFAAIAFFMSLQFLVYLLMLLNFKTLPYSILGRSYVVILLILIQLSFHLLQIYPKGETKGYRLLIFLFSLPGFVAIYLTLFTKFIISATIFEEYITFYPGPAFVFYAIIVFLYLLGDVILLVRKIIILHDKSLSRQLRLFATGISIMFFVLISMLFVWPILYNINQYRNIGVSIPQAIILLIVHYSVFDIRDIDFKNFYKKLIFWILFFIILFVPIYLLLRVNFSFFKIKDIPTILTAIIIFFYFAVFYKKIQLRMENVFFREKKNLINKLNTFFQQSMILESEKEKEDYWNNFYNQYIQFLGDSFGVLTAHFFIYNKDKDIFNYVYGYGEEPTFKKLNLNHDLTEILEKYSQVIDKSILYYDINYQRHTDDIISFFNQAGIEVALPILNEEKIIFGFILLGKLKNNKFYSKTFLSVLELYRIQFQTRLLNSLMLEKVKTEEIYNHDKLVLEEIKQNIIPKKLIQMPGFRASSFFINNSTYGGDYFDSIELAPEGKLAVFISNIRQSGIYSSASALELFSVLHSKEKEKITPDKILNAMNWVMTTSNYSKNNTPAFCLTYNSRNKKIEFSNAALNPLILFDCENGKFTEFEDESSPVGVNPDFIFSSKSQIIETETVGLIYSDGLITSIDTNGEKYSIARIKNIIKKEKDSTPAIIVRKIFDDYSNFINDKKQIDDASIIVFKIK